MQKQSKQRLPAAFSSVGLPEDFPCSASGLFLQRDAPIRSLHRHGCLELGYCHEGSGVFVVDRKVLPFHAGDVTVIDGSECHLAQSVTGTVSRWTWVYVDPRRLLTPASTDVQALSPRPLRGEGFQNVVSAKQDPDLGALVTLLIAELQDRHEGYRSAVRGLVQTIMCRLRRLPGVVEDDDDLPDEARRADALERIAPALQLMLNRYAKPLPIPLLAEHSGMSNVTFRRVFKAATGDSPLAYLTDLRLRMACVLLETTSQPISAIALSSGFPTLSSLNRHFQTRFKTSPRHWRRSRG